MPDSDLSEDPDSTEMADTRTAWAEDRTMLANERTFAGWMRTGMASIALALGLKAVFKDTTYPIIAKCVAEIFVLAGVIIFWTAVLNCRKARRRMKDHDVEAQSSRHMTWLAIILTIAAVATGIILFLL
ncbi:YidH family protein [Loktanella sp. DJP18]|uniref:YidH family protein n=1 Tax=Loktanella sp. DJP18 TaxID=3409788 RepID=UPI003BB6DAF7